MTKLPEQKSISGGIAVQGGFVWKTINELKYDHITKIKEYLSNYKHSFEDEQIGWVYDLMDYAQEQGVHA
jgi:hypothetical protein